MIFSIVKQSIDIRLRFPNPPGIHADTECAAVMGMLAKECGFSLPEYRTEFSVMRQKLLEWVYEKPADQESRAQRLVSLLEAYEPKAALDHETYELMRYSYDCE